MDTPAIRSADWGVLTEIMHPSSLDGFFDELDFIPDTEASVGRREGSGFKAVPFEECEKGDGTIDWLKPHVCVFIDNLKHEGSHKQLWVLYNTTDALHNFHIHQIKFRLAKWSELRAHHIQPPDQPQACPPQPEECATPNFKVYFDDRNADQDSSKEPLWHDTIPIPPTQMVFLIMSFDAEQQIGRFVYHCHILKHEDEGLMAPIEVWGPTKGQVTR